MMGDVVSERTVDGSIAGVRVLGAVCAVRADGSSVELASSSQRRLLAVLAIHTSRPLRGEWLADVMGVSPGALRTSISRLRAAIGAEVLPSAGAGYRVTAPADAHQFIRAVAAVPAEGAGRLPSIERALALWGGPPLEEFADEAWAEGEVARLTEIHAGTVDDGADMLIALGRAPEAVAHLEGQVAEHPYRDRSRGLLVRALAAAGRQADALRAFQRYRSLLGDEFGTEPSADVVRIERRVATGWDGSDDLGGTVVRRSLGASRAAPGAAHRFVAPWPAELPATGSFVGRHAELTQLRSALARTGTDGLGAVAITGEAGIGKTRLLAAFAQEVQASHGAAVLYGRCDQTPVPLQPLRAVLTTVVEHASTELLVAHVARCGGELGRICPRLWDRVATAPDPTRSDDATEQYLAFEAAADLVERIAAQQPLVMLLDDLQWAEPTALVLLRRLGRGLTASPILVVEAMREAGVALPEVLRRTVSDIDPAHVLRLPLGGLEPADLAEMVALATDEHAGTPGVVDLLHADTAGHPLYASQLLRHWDESGQLGAGPGPGAVTAHGADRIPLDLREVVTLRVEDLGPAVAQVLRTASVLGVEFTEEVLVEMETLPEATVADALDAATHAGFLEPTPSVRRCHRFTHVLVAHALSESLGGSRRARLHGRAVRAMQKEDDRLSTDTVVALARHARLAGWPAEAERWSALAGDRAMADMAPAEAASHYRAAHHLAEERQRSDGERADILVRLGEAQHRAGEAGALATLVEAAELARRAGAAAIVARAALAGDPGFLRFDPSASDHLHLVQAALEVVDHADKATSARLLAVLAQTLVYTPDAIGRAAAAEEALALAAELGDTTLTAQIGPGVQWGLTAPGQEVRRARVARETIAAAEATGDPRLRFAAHHSAYAVAIETADPAAAARSLAAVRAMARAVPEPRLRWVVGLYEAFEAMMTGHLEEAEAVATANWELGVAIESSDATTFFAGQMFVIGSFAGRHTELFPLVDQAARDNPGVLVFALARAVCCLGAGRFDEARAVLDDGRRHGYDAVPADNLWTTTVLGYAVLAIDLGDEGAARELLPLVEPLAATVAFNGITSQGPIAAYVGKLSSLIGLHGEAEHHLRHALATADAFGWTYHRATTLTALAQARHRAIGRLDDDCRRWLDEAAELCLDHGFHSWSAQVEDLLTRA